MTTDASKSKRGPKTKALKLEGPWEDRVRDSFKAAPMKKPAPKKRKKA